MGLERGGFILMISHYGRVAILGCIEIHYYHHYYLFIFFFSPPRMRVSTSISQTNKQNETARERRKERNDPQNR